MLNTLTKGLGPVGLALLIAFAATPAAHAHHGWSSFDTSKAYYVRGELTYVRWGNPHTEVHIRVDATDLPAGFRSRTLPTGADGRYGKATLASARPYAGRHKVLHVVLAGPSWMARWGLKRPLRKGETIEVVGFVARGDPEELRPVMFWLADGQGVWQQLTSFPTLPEPAPGQ